MKNRPLQQSTENSLDIKASPEAIYKALTNPEAMVVWQVPGNMTARIYNFDFRIGGEYQMSLFYPHSEKEMKGKTSGNEDKFSARFVELIPNKKIVEAIKFETSNPGLAGEMIMEVTLLPVSSGTRVTFLFKNIPKGIKPQDNEAGTISSLQKLARYVEG